MFMHSKKGNQLRFNAISVRSLKYPIWKVGAFKNKFLWYAVGSSFILQLIVLYTPGVNSAFDVNAPEPLDWGFAILFTAITFTTLETAKWIMSMRRKKQTRAGAQGEFDNG